VIVQTLPPADALDSPVSNDGCGLKLGRGEMLDGLKPIHPSAMTGAD